MELICGLATPSGGTIRCRVSADARQRPLALCGLVFQFLSVTSWRERAGIETARQRRLRAEKLEGRASPGAGLGLYRLQQAPRAASAPASTAAWRWQCNCVVRDPAVRLLDEPTAGLDWSDAPSDVLQTVGPAQPRPGSAGGHPRAGAVPWPLIDRGLALEAGPRFAPPAPPLRLL